VKILYVHRTRGIGAEGVHIEGMCEAFTELGHEVEVLGPPGCNPGATSSSGCRSSARGKLRTSSSSGVRSIYWFIAEHWPQIFFELLELLYNGPLLLQLLVRFARFKPDIVYERYALNTFAPSLVCRLTGCRHVLEVNDSVVIDRPRTLVRTSGICWNAASVWRRAEWQCFRTRSRATGSSVLSIAKECGAGLESETERSWGYQDSFFPGTAWSS
jgi:hypothetical protein